MKKGYLSVRFPKQLSKGIKMRNIQGDGFLWCNICRRQSGMTLIDLMFVLVYMGITFSLGAYFVFPSSYMEALNWPPFLKLFLSMVIGFIAPLAVIALHQNLVVGMKKYKGVVRWMFLVLFFAYISGWLWIWILLSQVFFRRMGWI